VSDLCLVQSPPSPVGVAADLLASAADQNVRSWRSAPAATEVERLAVLWLGVLVGSPTISAGLLLSGGSAANLTALRIALRAGTDENANRRRLMAYSSEEAHFSIAKAAAAVRMRRVGSTMAGAWMCGASARRSRPTAD
jgi:aromatic-L-amino-acid decarboxylase